MTILCTIIKTETLIRFCINFRLLLIYDYNLSVDKRSLSCKDPQKNPKNRTLTIISRPALIIPADEEAARNFSGITDE